MSPRGQGARPPPSTASASQSDLAAVQIDHVPARPREKERRALGRGVLEERVDVEVGVPGDAARRSGGPGEGLGDRTRAQRGVPRR